MRSLRIDEELDEKIRRAASLNDESISDFLRTAAEERADRVLSTQGREAFADVAGAVRSHGGQADRTGHAFTEVLRSKKSS